MPIFSPPKQLLLGQWRLFKLLELRRLSAFAENKLELEALRVAARHAIMKEQIYCTGTLLDAVQRGHLFKDCKTFVDMPLKADAETTLLEWNKLYTSEVVTVDRLRDFIEKHFDEPEEELVHCNPADWDPKANSFEEVADESYRLFAAALHKKWPTLHRKVSDKVRLRPERYSLISVPNPFIIPGGRFREIYYWDSFFIIKGLIASRMMDTVRGMIENMQYLIESFGFVPNGNRVYYLNRSQPPLLTWCAYAYYNETKDAKFLESILPTLKKEMDFFAANRSLQMDGWPSPLFRYHLVATQPRPESYREDIESAEEYENLVDKCRLWGDIAAAAESGQDFSSRWFEQSGPHAQKMSGTRTSQIIPVDLNAIICGNLRMMSEMYAVLGNGEQSNLCAKNYENMRTTIEKVLWSEEHGIWFDFDLRSNSRSEIFHDTNLFPMVTGAYHVNYDGRRTTEYLRSSGVLAFPGGIPCSLIPTGQQWDFPNAWAPTSWVIIMGLFEVGQEEIALELAQKWVRKNYNMWKGNSGTMFEKYNVVSPCGKAAGGGGEYEMQEGFGWTNGVILDLLTKFGRQLVYDPETRCPCCPPQGVRPEAVAA